MALTKPPVALSRLRMIGPLVVAVGILAGLVLPLACRENTAPVQTTAEPRIVSLVPQASEILESIGCREHLVAVSNYDDDPAVAGLPRVGDYQTADWEAIAGLHPAYIITHYGSGQTPAGFQQHAKAIGAQQLNLLTETLTDADEKLTIYYAITQLGKICGEPLKADAAAARLRARLTAVHARVASEKIVPAMIITGEQGATAAGRSTYLSNLLTLAGGSNVVAGLDARYPRLDTEQLVQLRPQVILQLLPNATPQVQAQARAFWMTLPDVPAVKNGRVVQLTGWYVELPGYHVGDVAEEFAEALHPQAAAK